MDQPDLQDIAHQRLALDGGLALECGVTLKRLEVAYRTYGRLNADRSNAVLVCHALTGDQSLAEKTSCYRQGRVVGHGRGAGARDRHQPVLRHLLERARRLHGPHRAAQPAR